MATPPSVQVFDDAGRLVELRLCRSGTCNPADSSTWDKTKWQYTATGYLEKKIDAANRAVEYNYDALGRLVTRRWARGVVTTYAYLTEGVVQSVTYSDGTPSVTWTYNRAGQVRQIQDRAGTRSITYTGFDAVEDEVYTGGSILNGLSIDRTFDASGRLRTIKPSGARGTTYSYSAETGIPLYVNSGDQQVAHTIDAAGRITARIGTYNGDYGIPKFRLSQ